MSQSSNCVYVSQCDADTMRLFHRFSIIIPGPLSAIRLVFIASCITFHGSHVRVRERKQPSARFITPANRRSSVSLALCNYYVAGIQVFLERSIGIEYMCKE